MGKELVMGSFTAEKYWRDSDYTNLQNIAENNADNIIMPISCNSISINRMFDR
jgi:hypothetical protein